MKITPAVAQYLEAVRIPLRLGCTTPGDWPLVVSLWFEYRDGLLYCASHRQAKVISYLQRNSRCGFEIAGDEPPYCGVRGQALATLDDSQGGAVLERLLRRYVGGLDKPLSQRLLQRRDHEVAIILEPVNLFSWNFTDRMKDSVEIKPKPCPG
jgi:nitroimidazol reductase NimA-like FMN-containing flavoprotein (pyridoxamine 5'-phosphate oxidase superfamily)